MTPKAEVKSAEIFTETHSLGVKIDTEHAGTIIFKPKSSKTYELDAILGPLDAILGPHRLLFLLN